MRYLTVTSMHIAHLRHFTIIIDFTQCFVLFAFCGILGTLCFVDTLFRFKLSVAISSKMLLYNLTTFERFETPFL